MRVSCTHMHTRTHVYIHVCVCVCVERVFGDGVIDFFVGRDALCLSLPFPTVYITPPCVALARLFRPTTLARASSRIRNMAMIKERVTRSSGAGGSQRSLLTREGFQELLVSGFPTAAIPTAAAVPASSVHLCSPRLLEALTVPPPTPPAAVKSSRQKQPATGRVLRQQLSKDHRSC